MKYVKSLVRRGFKGLGLDVGRHNPMFNPTYRVNRSFDRFGIDLIFDVGANTGQFGTELRSVGYKGRIVSFEPLSTAHRELSVVAAGDSNWDVHPRGAVGDLDGTTTINIAGNSVSSSVLPMTTAHSSAAPASAFVTTEVIPIRRLDSLASSYLAGSRQPLLKIDTQGFEWQVLDGAMETLPRMKGVFCELSLVSLYEGQRLWREIIDRLQSSGFTLWSILEGFTDPRDGRTLQVDATFFRL